MVVGEMEGDLSEMSKIISEFRVKSRGTVRLIFLFTYNFSFQVNNIFSLACAPQMQLML